METLAYLHLAIVHEAPPDSTDVLTLDSLKLFEWFKQEKLAIHPRLYWLSLVIILSLWGMAGEALAQRILKLGDQGSDVTEVQQLLQQQGFFSGPITGYFGSITRNAVLQFQQANGLNPDGIVGQDTQSILFNSAGTGRVARTQSYNPLPPPPSVNVPPLVSSDNSGIFGDPIPVTSRRVVLRQGDQGSDVEFLQQRLREEGFYSGQTNGFFDAETEEAVKLFQRSRGLSEDGIAGSDTLTALNATTLFEPINQTSSQRVESGSLMRTLRLGSSGSDVSVLQQRLREEGVYSGSTNGFFDTETETAVRQFQRNRGLRIDGIAGQRTFAALGIGDIVNYAQSRPNRRQDITLRPGDRNIRVEELQRRLQAAGFYTGSIDGIYETGTSNAVRRLQKENNLPETGVANRDTQVALASYRYVVIVPDPSGELLPQVRRRFLDAVLGESRRGPYIKAGVFNNRAKAESRAQLLRASKFDARVVFQ